MLRLAADENVPGDVLRGLARRIPEIDISRVQDAGLRGAKDPAVLDWAATEDRVLVTADRATMIEFAARRVRAGERMPGLIVLGRRTGVGSAIDDLVLAATSTEPAEWVDQIVFFPL